MKRMLARTGGAALVLALGCWSPVGAQELPFEATPEGFVEYLNSGVLGSSHKFFNPRNCGVNPAFPTTRSYGCIVDERTRSALGERTCIQKTFLWQESNISGYNNIRSEGGECSPWKEVAAEPPKEKTSEVDQSTQPGQPAQSAQSAQSVQSVQSVQSTTTEGITLNNFQFFGGGIIVFLLGIATGVISTKRNY